MAYNISEDNVLFKMSLCGHLSDNVHCATQI